MRETEIATPVVEWLVERGWDGNQEVEVRSGYPVADIVAVMGLRVWVVECKTTMGLDLMAQAFYWQQHAHWVSVAVPRPKKRGSKSRRLAISLLGARGVGAMEVDKGAVETRKKPVLCRWASPWWQGERDGDHRRWHLRDIQALRGALCAEHKHFEAAGSPNGRHWSTWQFTCQQAVRAVQKNPGMSLKEMVDSIDHHYSSDSSARSSMSHWIREGRVPGIEARKDGRRVRLYPAGPQT